MSLFCEICTELITPSEDLRATSCGHIFHYDCVSKWFSRGHNTCPHCREPNVSRTLLRIFLTCVNEDQVHLNRNCDVVQLRRDLWQAKTSLCTLKNDLERVNQDNEELQLKLLSLEEYYTRELKVGNLKELQSKLNSNFENNRESGWSKRSYENQISLEELLNRKCKIEDNNQKELLSLKLILQEKENELMEANEDIKQLRLQKKRLYKRIYARKD